MTDSSDASEPQFLRLRQLRAVWLLSLLYIGTFVVLWRMGDGVQLVLCGTLTPVLIWLSIRDVQAYELPDRGTVSVALVGCFATAIGQPDAFVLHGVIAVLTFAVFWAIGELHFRLRGREGLGIGDAKLFAAGTMLLGPWQVPELILLASLGGLLFHGISAFRGGARGRQGIPFGPFIAYAIYVLNFLDPIFL